MNERVTDFLGNELSIGDFVAFHWEESGQLKVGVVQGFYLNRYETRISLAYIKSSGNQTATVKLQKEVAIIGDLENFPDAEEVSKITGIII